MTKRRDSNGSMNVPEETREELEKPFDELAREVTGRGLMETDKTYKIDGLADSDKDNLAESKRALLALHADSLSATDECADLLERISVLFGEGCGYDKYNQQVNDWVKRQSGGAEQTASLLEQAKLIGHVEGDDPVAEAQDALHKGNSVIGRVYLLLRLERDFLFGLSDLLRLRVTSMFGYLRVQTETVAILALSATDSAMAVNWLNAKEGKEFYKNHHHKIVDKLRQLALYHYYEDASNTSLHSRVGGVAPGIIIGGKEATPKRQVKLTYQEIDDPVILFLWFCVYLKAHKEMIDKLPQALPEVDFSQIDVRRFGTMVDSLWATLRPLWVRKRGKGLMDIMS
jgi:hypothetical protein